MALYADVIVDISLEKLDRVFQYRVPPALADRVRVGSRIRVPFGRGKRVIDGYVMGLAAKPNIDEEKIRDIEDLAKDAPGVEGKLIELAAWIRETYGSTFVQALKTVLPVKREKRREKTLSEFSGLEKENRVPLTRAQEEVLRGILEEWEGGNRPCLIRGITGSGKTHVYLELIDRVLTQGKGAIILIPEIALSWQTVRRIYGRFGDRVALLHSKMTPAERADQFARVREGEADIVIGPRSALFAPLPDLGLIIIDEEHENSYVSEMTPRYHARETACERARIAGAHLVLGSATPSVDARYRAEAGIYRLFSLEERYGEAELPAVHIADMREELSAGNRSVFSRILQDKISERLEHKEQVMLFLNRRGQTGFLSCRACGYVVKCPHCDVSLTAHRGGKLICHYCGYTSETVSSCPSCGSRHIKGFSVGTEKIEQEAARLFPNARVLRMDADSTKKRGSYEEILKTFADRKADILVGTQMIVKGHDFPGVTLVGAVAADLSLFADDYRAAERTYQLLVQAVGRAGRGEKSGEAVIQTYRPEHYSIRAAASQDYEAFYREEIDNRELCDYPPATGLLAIRCSGTDEAKLDLAVDYLRKYLERLAKKKSTQIIGPAPEKISKVKDRYRRVLYLKEKTPAELSRLREGLEKYIEINAGFADIRIQYDLNP